MRALNHINLIVYKGKKNILKYKLDLHYASLNDRCFPKYVRDLVPEIFQQIKGFCDIQRYVLSIESPVERTYVGFDSHKHRKKCYYKFTYKKNLVHFRKNTDNMFWKKNNYKYLMIISQFYKSILDQCPKIIEQIMKSSKDFQENCRELDLFSPESEKRSVLVYYNFIGYESNEDLDKAFDFLENNTKSALPYYKKYHEGYSYVDVTNYPKEAYLFYNSL